MEYPIGTTKVVVERGPEPGPSGPMVQLTLLMEGKSLEPFIRNLVTILGRCETDDSIEGFAGLALSALLECSMEHIDSGGKEITKHTIPVKRGDVGGKAN